MSNNFLKDAQVLATLGPSLFNSIAVSPPVAPVIDRISDSSQYSQQEQHQDPKSCSLEDQPVMSKSMELKDQLTEPGDLGDWAEAQKENDERDSEIDLSAKSQSINDSLTAANDSSPYLGFRGNTNDKPFVQDGLPGNTIGSEKMADRSTKLNDILADRYSGNQNDSSQPSEDNFDAGEVETP